MEVLFPKTVIFSMDKNLRKGRRGMGEVWVLVISESGGRGSGKSRSFGGLTKKSPKSSSA